MSDETFEKPEVRKWLRGFFLEGYLAVDTTLNISLLFDGGFTQTLTGSIKGTDTDFLFNTSGSNAFGVNAFGVEAFGSEEGESALKKFRLYLKKDLREIPFYSIQCKFASEGNLQNWQVIRYGFDVGLFSQDENRKLYKTLS